MSVELVQPSFGLGECVRKRRHLVLKAAVALLQLCYDTPQI